jgi:hypothetical protein
MKSQSLVIPLASFVLALLLGLLTGPMRTALSRQAGGNTCQPTCSVTKSPATDPDEPAPEAVAVAAPRRPGDFKGSGEFVNVVNANTGNVGSVTVTVGGWQAVLQCSPPGSSGGGGSGLKGTLSIGGQTVSVQRWIIYGAGSMPGEITISGTGSVTAGGLNTCSSVSGNITWNVSAFAAYFGPNGAKRSVVSDATVAGWTCSAQ